MISVVYVVVGLLAGAALVIGLVLATRVENWRRDLTTHFATTDESSPDERLRPLRTHLAPGELAEIIEARLRKWPHWHFKSRIDQAGTIELRFVRTTSVMRFRDDIRILVQPHDGGSLLSAQSRSRFALGDLGQNPRNLRELLAMVKDEAG